MEQNTSAGSYPPILTGVHLWQHLHGKPGKGNYHHKQFRDKAASLGLMVSDRGEQWYVPSSPFLDLLKQFDLSIPRFNDLQQPQPKQKGSSKSRKWVCDCQPQYAVRVAISDFCARCGSRFRPSSN